MSQAIEPFIPFGSFHFAALAALALLGTGIIIMGKNSQQARKNHPRPTTVTAALTVCVLLGIAAGLISSLYNHPEMPWAEHLPLHFCDVMAVMCAFALLFHSKTIKAIAFFCTLCASSQALITPNLQDNFPSLTYFSFFASHGLTVIAAIYLMCALNWKPSKYDFIKAQLFGLIYLALIHPFNILLNTNFGFTRYIPQNDSVLSLLGPWPWYLLTMQIPALIFMGLLNQILLKKHK